MNKGDVVIRPAEQRDLPVLGRLGGLLVRAHHAFDRQRFMAPTAGVDEGYAWFLGTQLAKDDVVIFVAEQKVNDRDGPNDPHQGAVIGYVYAGIEEKSWMELRDTAGFVHDVVVEEACRGAGVGARLVEAASAWLAARGMPRVMLWTAEMNAPARRLFAKVGFRTTMIEMTRETAVQPSDRARRDRPQSG